MSAAYILLAATLWNLVVLMFLGLTTLVVPKHVRRSARALAWVSAILVGLVIYFGLASPASAQRVSEKQMVFGPSCLCERYKTGQCHVSTGTLTYHRYTPEAYVSEYCASGKPVVITAILYLAQAYSISAVFIYETR